VLAHDGASRALGAGERIEPDPALTAALEGDRSGLLASADLEHIDDPMGALAFDLESAAVLAAAARAGIPAACLVAIEGAIEPDEVAERLGRAALAAIAPVRA
jgi:hypothetical protein